MTQDDCYLLGYIVKSHGTKGQLVFHLDVDYPEEYEELESVFLEIKGDLIPYFVESFNLQKKGRSIVQLEGVDTMEKALALVGTSLFMPLETLEELDDEGFYYHEIQGFEVLDENLGALGTVREVYSVATQNLIALDYQGSEVLIPIVDGIVLKADRKKKQVLVSLPEGLLEVYTGGADDEKDGDDED
ncbi:ribosome maturation factor RimM [Persicitalea jodogahamensis]|uniref:Ribosome maturation factor RimM n=1 Tax=Persicitalea jodogahamensis TaxID=402147 RepID=A0A8J3D270_9BACT|nr:ribosome maturation factor RimM [Persicitalea jodogahamensis]GHB58858.1 ribosome maturation factor RimM [Persicitalea jodogahamensis]